MADQDRTRALDDREREVLRRHARACIAAAVRDARPPAPPPDPSPALRACRGVFVTVRLDGELAGCIGDIRGAEPLLDGVGRCAVEAALHDPRFPPLRAAQLPHLQLEITVLDPPRPVADLREVVPGRHGVVVSRGEAVGVLLPQVAERYGWDARTFVEQAARKAGIDQDHLADVRIEVFQAERV